MPVACASSGLGGTRQRALLSARACAARTETPTMEAHAHNCQLLDFS